ncbi:hypothetical protein LINPERHAP2_LOCUS33504 [Linum perenne]
MGSDDTETKELYFVFMKYDPEYDRLKADRSVTLTHDFFSLFIILILLSEDRTKRGAHELDVYLSKKHDHLLSTSLQLGTYNKTCSLVIVDGFAVEITQDQANVLRSADGVRLVEKNQELP